MHPRLTIENSAGDLLHVQLHPDRVRDALNSPLWFQFLVGELVSSSAIHGVVEIEMLPLGTELTQRWLEVEGNELVNPPLEWEFTQRMVHALEHQEHPIVRIAADFDRVLVRRSLNDWFGDGNGPMVVGVEKNRSSAPGRCSRHDVDLIEMYGYTVHMHHFSWYPSEEDESIMDGIKLVIAYYDLARIQEKLPRARATAVRKLLGCDAKDVGDGAVLKALWDAMDEKTSWSILQRYERLTNTGKISVPWSPPGGWRAAQQ